ncbi:MAG: TolC family protein [Acidobacteriia bacterium]|nr:TolC family protein [Terriglobia bacterium]
MIVRSRCFLHACALTLCLALVGSAQALTEREALELLRASPYSRQLRAEAEIARVGAERQKTYPNPAVSATLEGAGRTDFLMFEQALPVNGRRSLLYEAAESGARAAMSSADHTLRQVEAALRRSFYRLVYLQIRGQMAREHIAESEELLRILREREAEGEGSKFDRLQGEREIVEQETDLAQIEVMMGEARAELARYLGDAVSPAGLAADGTLGPGFDLPPLRDAVAAGLSARGDYRVEAERLEQLRLEDEAAQRLRIPNPVVSGGVKRAEVAGQFVTGPVLGVSVALPVFRKGRVERAVAAAKTIRTQERRSALERQILAEVRSSHEALRLRRQMARDYRSQSEQRVQELAGIAEVAYREGELGILDLLETRRVAHRARLQQLELDATAKLAEVEFDRSVAKELLP